MFRVTSGFRTLEGPRGLLPPLGERMRPLRFLYGNWGYTPRDGVFVLDIASMTDGSLIQEEFTSLQEAVDRFAELALPVQTGWSAKVVDSRVSVLLMYIDEGARSARRYPDGNWAGCAAGFAALEATGAAHPVDLALWETIARGESAITPVEP